MNRIWSLDLVSPRLPFEGWALGGKGKEMGGWYWKVMPLRNSTGVGYVSLRISIRSTS